MLAALGLTPAAGAHGALAAPAGAPSAAGQIQLILDHGRVLAQRNPYLPAPEALPVAVRRAPATAARARARAVSVPSVLTQLQRSAALSPSAAQNYLAQYERAVRALGVLRGTRALELGAVLGNVRTLAADGGLSASRLAAVFRTLDANRQWWTTASLLVNGTRVGFAGSRLVWQYYAGQGIQIQWLGTFGEANGYYLSGRQDANLRAVLDEAIALAAARAGGLAWEYLFHFDGGAPPWTSGLSQGTAIQALARASARLHVAAYLDAAQRALGIFQVPPPEGIRVPTRAGAHYLEYSYAPGERILNGFVQALVGLYDYTALTGDPLGGQLFGAGDAEGRVEVPTYDTGAWSLYDQYGESDLSYHQLLTGFLANLCSRTRGALDPLAAGSPGGGGAAAATPPPARRSQSPGGPDAVYCLTAQRFKGYETTPPAARLFSGTARAGTQATLRFSLSKIADVRVTVSGSGPGQLLTQSRYARGLHAITWVPARGPASATVTLLATDLAGNHASTTTTVTVLAPARRSRVTHRRAGASPRRARSADGRRRPGPAHR